MTPLTRREFLQVGGTAAFFGLLTYLGMGRVQKTFSRFHPFLAGLDFEAYAPQVQVDGRFVESVGNWASNTIPTDFISWLNGMYGNAISFRPYQGDLANLRANTLEEVLQRGEGYIRELAKTLGENRPPRYLVVRVSENPSDYGFSPRYEDKVSYALLQAMEASLRHNTNGNILVELEASPHTSAQEHNQRMQDALNQREKAGVPLTIVSSLDEHRLSKKGAEDFFKLSDALMVSFSEVQGLEEKVRYARSLAGNQLFFARLKVGHYFSGKMAWTDADRATEALEILYRHANGCFVDDQNGLLLYKDLFGGSPLDGGKLKEAVKTAYKKFLRIKVK